MEHENSFVEPVDKRDDFKVTRLGPGLRYRADPSLDRFQIADHVATEISSSFDDCRGKFSARVTVRANKFYITTRISLQLRNVSMLNTLTYFEKSGNIFIA